MNSQQIDILAKMEKRAAAQRGYSQKNYLKNKESILGKRKLARMNEQEIFKQAITARDMQRNTIIPEIILKEPELVENENSIDEPIVEIQNISSTQKSYNLQECIQLLKNKIQVPSTLDSYIGHLKRFFHMDKLNSCGGGDIIKCLRNYKQISKKIAKGEYNGKVYGVSSILGVFQILLYMMDNFFKEVFTPSTFKVIHDHLDDYFQKFVGLSNDHFEAQRESQIVPSFENYINLVRTKFGDDSIEMLIVLLYQNFTVRDNYNMIIVDKLADASELKTNYIIVPRDNKSIILLVKHYKTSKKFNDLKFSFSNSKEHVKIQNMLREHINTKNRNYGDYLFTKTSLSAQISKTNKSLGFAVGGVNLYRHMKASEHYQSKFSFKDREKLAKQMGHSIHTQKKYVRQLKITPVDE